MYSCRLADSGFMTCQLAQLLAPIRTASIPIDTPDSSPSTPPKTSRHMTPSAVATTAPAVADPAFEASLEVAAASLLAEIGIDCSSELITRANSNAHSKFEFISRAASDTETAVNSNDFGGDQWLGPAVSLAKSASAVLGSAVLDSTESAALYSPTLHSTAPISAVL